MRVLLFGSRGMLGTDLEREFEALDSEVMGVDREDFDVTHGPDIREVFSTIDPEVVVNATGYTNVDGAETDREAAFGLNDQAVRYLAEAAASVNARFVHVSTEMVFDGEQEQGYDEAAEPKPVNVYGESKAAGEKHVMEYSQGYLVRSSWLFGKAAQRGKPRGANFIDTVLKLAYEQGEVRVVNDQFGKPTSTQDLARAICSLMTGHAAPGVYHLTNDGVASWYDVAKFVFSLKGITTPLTPILSAAYPTPARRPKYGVLVNTKVRPLRPWQEAVTEYINMARI
jgi:dTDP-4-dehydrorhamnose reductase